MVCRIKTCLTFTSLFAYSTLGLYVLVQVEGPKQEENTGNGESVSDLRAVKVYLPNFQDNRKRGIKGCKRTE